MIKLKALLVTLLVTIGLVSMTQPASANIGSYHWQYGTIYVQNVSSTHPWSPDIMNRVLYYHNLGAHWNVVQGDCQVGYPCIRLSIGAYGTSGDWANGTVGNTYFPYLCGGGSNFCNYAGNMNDTTHRMGIAINTSYGEMDPAVRRKVGCHEFGHGLAYLQHESNTLGATCMNATIGSSTPEFLNSTDISQIKNRFASIPLTPTTGAVDSSMITGDAPATESD